MDNSLPWDQVDPVPYDRYGSTPIDLATLKEKADKRVEQDEGAPGYRRWGGQGFWASEKTTVSLKLADMKAKRAEAKVARDKIGAHYLKYREEQDAEHGELPTAGTDDKKDKDKWKEEVKEDPYINESLHILGDMQ